MHQKLILYTQTQTHGILDNVSYPILRVFQKIRLSLPLEEADISTAKDTQTDKDTHRHDTQIHIHRYIYTDTKTTRHRHTNRQRHTMVGWYTLDPFSLFPLPTQKCHFLTLTYTFPGT